MDSQILRQIWHKKMVLISFLALQLLELSLFKDSNCTGITKFGTTWSGAIITLIKLDANFFNWQDTLFGRLCIIGLHPLAQCHITCKVRWSQKEGGGREADYEILQC